MGRIKWCWGKFHLHILYIGNDIQDMPLPNNFVSIIEYIILPTSYSVFKYSLHEICPKCYRFIRFFLIVQFKCQSPGTSQGSVLGDKVILTRNKY